MTLEVAEVRRLDAQIVVAPVRALQRKPVLYGNRELQAGLRLTLDLCAFIQFGMPFALYLRATALSLVSADSRMTSPWCLNLYH